MVLGKGNFPGVPSERSGDAVDMELFQILAKQVAKLGQDLIAAATFTKKLEDEVNTLKLQVKALEKTSS